MICLLELLPGTTTRMHTRLCSAERSSGCRSLGVGGRCCWEDWQSSEVLPSSEICPFTAACPKLERGTRLLEAEGSDPTGHPGNAPGSATAAGDEVGATMFVLVVSQSRGTPHQKKQSTAILVFISRTPKQVPLSLGNRRSEGAGWFRPVETLQEAVAEKSQLPLYCEQAWSRQGKAVI